MAERPLRELLSDLVGDADARLEYGADPAGYLAAHGHPDLPEPLVAEAVVSFADTAPIEVAGVLAPYVTAHGPVPSDQSDQSGSPDWLDLLTSVEPAAEDVAPVAEEAWADPEELDFGAGSDEPSVVDVAVEAPEIGESPEPEATDWSTAVEPPAHAPAVPFEPEPPIEGLEDDDPLD